MLSDLISSLDFLLALKTDRRAQREVHIMKSAMKRHFYARNHQREHCSKLWTGFLPLRLVCLSVERHVSGFPSWATMHIKTGDWAKEQTTELRALQPSHHVQR